MYSNFYLYRGAVGGSADGVFGDAVLCVGIFYFLGAAASAIRIFIIIELDGVCGGERAGVISGEGAPDGGGADAGAENSVHFAACSFNFGARGDVGGGDVAGDYV